MKHFRILFLLSAICAALGLGGCAGSTIAAERKLSEGDPLEGLEPLGALPQFPDGEFVIRV
ncbi:MAG: hypothetical protein PHR92_03930 [Lachnospiraceae bacterium]|nr:hypothetical protein [Lachnospiraceae bacterium]